jgi:hypothetical protein
MAEERAKDLPCLCLLKQSLDDYLLSVYDIHAIKYIRSVCLWGKIFDLHIVME